MEASLTHFAKGYDGRSCTATLNLLLATAYYFGSKFLPPPLP